MGAGPSAAAPRIPLNDGRGPQRGCVASRLMMGARPSAAPPGIPLNGALNDGRAPRSGKRMAARGIMLAEAGALPGGGAAVITFKINGTERTWTGDGAMPLLWYLRDVLGLTGTKFGCGEALCGACTVHQNGQAVRA
ncbi:MAG: (2Fe-2S)-binding protein, partial [Terriglobales bacterium]